MGLDAYPTRRFAPASACSSCRTRATRASTWPATRRDAVRTPPTSFSVRTGTRPSWASGTNACGVQPPIVCISNHYVLGNDFDRTTPRMLQYLFNVQREIGGNSAIEIGYLGSRSSQLERMFDRNDVIPGAAARSGQAALPGVHPGSDDRQRRRSEVQLADGQADAPPQQRVLGAHRLHALEIRGQRQRHPHAQRRSAVPAEQQLRGGRSRERMRVGRARFSTSRHRVVSSILYELPFGAGKKYRRRASAARSSAAGRSPTS